MAWSSGNPRTTSSTAGKCASLFAVTAEQRFTALRSKLVQVALAKAAQYIGER